MEVQTEEKVELQEEMQRQMGMQMRRGALTYFSIAVITLSKTNMKKRGFISSLTTR